jgi:hypothetical protein
VAGQPPEQTDSPGKSRDSDRGATWG